MEELNKSRPYSFNTKAERDFVIANLKSFVKRNAANLKLAQEALADEVAEQYIMQRGW